MAATYRRGYQGREMTDVMEQRRNDPIHVGAGP